VAAPGSNIRSSVNTSDTASRVAGAALDVSAARHRADSLDLPGRSMPARQLHRDREHHPAIRCHREWCARVMFRGRPRQVPNQSTGWGEIRALAAVQLALTSCGPMGMLDGTVTAAGSGTPIANAVVQAIGTERTSKPGPMRRVTSP